jgi:putative transposase
LRTRCAKSRAARPLPTSADVCRQLGVSEATFYIWKRKYAHLGISGLRKLRSLEEEHARLKRVVADVTLDKHMLAEALRKGSEARAPPRIGRLVPGDLRREGAGRASAFCASGRSYDEKVGW